MKRNDPTVQFQCRVTATATIWALSILCLVLLSICAAVVFTINTWFISVLYIAIMGGPAIFVLVNLLLQAASILTITADTVHLTRFGKPRIEFQRSEITAVGRVLLCNNKGECLYIASEGPENNHATLYHRLKRTANKKGAAYICVELTPQRAQALQALFPSLDLEACVSYDRPEGRK